ncbi:MAG: hypothetical protein CMD14_00515 [Flavobacteriales bacterium]|nr:hypothetical protein [Flavobacteriales bacterium]|tara:strand:- start:2916 stop:3359 length:444 start_codon:yes stop_codon:yes gene_type:complete
MKRLLYTFLALSFIFSSCEKEEESNNSSDNNSNLTLTNQNIVGVWQINSLVYDGVDYTEVVGFEGASLEMNSDNTFMLRSIYLGELETEVGNWDLNGSGITLDYDGWGDEAKWNVSSFNGTTAILTLVHYLVGGENYYDSGSATIVK